MTHFKRAIRNHTVTALIATTATFVVLRALEQLDWNWFLVFTPLWAPLILSIVVGMALGTGRGLDALIEKPYQYQDNGPGGVEEMEQMLVAGLQQTQVQPQPTSSATTRVYDITEEQRDTALLDAVRTSDGELDLTPHQRQALEDAGYGHLVEASDNRHDDLPVPEETAVEPVVVASVDEEYLEPLEEPTTSPEVVETQDVVEDASVVVVVPEDEPVEEVADEQPEVDLLYARRGNWEAFATATESGKVILLQVHNLASEVSGKISVTARTAHEELKAQASEDGTWQGRFRALAPTAALSAVAGKTVPNIWHPYAGDLPQD